MWILIAIVVLVIDYIIANKFEKIANMKGHSGYFWWCFLLGFVGYIMVAALPATAVQTAPAAPAAPELSDELPKL